MTRSSPAGSSALPARALGSILVAAIGRRLSVQVLRETVQATTRITAMVLFHSSKHTGILARLTRPARREAGAGRLHAHPRRIFNASIWFLTLLIVLLGFFIEWIEISYIAVLLFLPIFISANIDLVWLSTLICVNLQPSFLTSPSAGQALVIVFMFPGLATWLPKAIGW